MKKAALALLALLVIAVTAPVRAQDSQPKITVSGEAVLKVAPDRVVITFGIETMDLDLEKAKAANDRILQRALQRITGCCAESKDIQTTHLSIAPRYRDGKDFIGYFVDNTFAVTLKDPANIEKLLTAALQSGVTNIDNLSFETSEFKKYREQARELALKAAREKADKMAAVLGAKAGAPLQIIEQGGDWGYFGPRNMSQNVLQSVGEAPDDVSGSVALGQISIRASVSVTFALIN